MEKLTENQVIEILAKYLEGQGWKLKEPYKLNRSQGIDIYLEKDGVEQLIEAKGARGNPMDKNVTRKKFSAGQIKTHFGVALVKSLKEKTKNPDAIIAIAQPDDPDIRNVLKDIIGYLRDLGIKHYWVSESKVLEA